MKQGTQLLLLSVFLFFILSAPAFAQKGLEVGVRVIPQSVWIINDDDAARGDGLDYTRTWGMAYGLNVGYNFLSSLGIQTGLLISGQGQKYVGDGSSGFETSQTKLNYLKIPVMLKFNSNPDAGACFVGTAGIQFGLLTGAKQIVDDEEVDFGALGLELKDAYNKADLSAAFSLGSRFRVTDSFNIGLSLRADYSLGDIEDKDFVVAGFPVWDNDRAASANLTGGIMIEANYILGAK
ncbi:MAG: PorT family protein [Sphingobacteriales bacterium]|nr:MAG: PorT family protein [Sphingobacteriales bacterium]